MILRLAVAFLVFGVVLLIAMMLTPANATGPCIVADSSLDGQEALFVVLLNGYRQSNGLTPLTVSPTLNRSAEWMAADEQTHGYFSHTDSLGRDPFQRMTDCGYAQAGGENLAMGYLPTAQAVLMAWQSSPGHNAAMLQPGFTQLGVAHVGANWTLDFGYGAEGVVIPWPTVAPTPRPHIYIPAVGRD